MKEVLSITKSYLQLLWFSAEARVDAMSRLQHHRRVARRKEFMRTSQPKLGGAFSVDLVVGNTTVAHRRQGLETLKTDFQRYVQAIQSSTRVYHQCGRVSLSTFPRLSEKALHLLYTAKEPSQSFSAIFGDYFVAGYLLGAGNVSMISGAGASEAHSKKLNIDVEVHLDFISRQDKIHEESLQSAQVAAGTLPIYDSLTDQHIEQPISDIDKALAVWEENKARAETLQQRAAIELSKMHLIADESTIPHTRCDELCGSGLVLELLLFPWTGLRDYTSAVLAPRGFPDSRLEMWRKFDFLNTSKVKESDISFLFSVKVVNQVLYDYTLTEIVPIGIGDDEPAALDAQTFTDIYGDSFISGFQEGGTFTAVISVKAKSEKKKRDIKAKADVFFTKPKSEEGRKASGKGKNSFDLNLTFDNLNDSFLRENETTISVSYTGGGQKLKTPLVAETPMRTHAILTKYISLRSYHTRFGGMSPPNFEVAAVYCMLLQEAYLDYKTVAKDLQVLAFDVTSGKADLITSSEYRQKVDEAKKEKARLVAEKKKKVDDINKVLPIGEPGSKPGSDTRDIKQSEKAEGTDLGETISKPSSGPNHWQQINITKEYKSTLQGLEDARSMVRTFLVRIVQEINILSKSPNLALENNRVQPHMSPFLFKELLPVGQPAATDEEQGRELDNVTDRIGQVRALKDNNAAI
ncbi:hypothetical protein FCIRC_13676 [Fusarium circinatum]|uniref:Uncharacterized protein n=1 Tax=Fusarium circinatum TaxID=48490 RepID=A0A8H5SSS0_FUSCI|nr:hypothetical protein FCIRC_13676 [Fusarium circinatum]